MNQGIFYKVIGGAKLSPLLGRAEMSKGQRVRTFSRLKYFRHKLKQSLRLKTNVILSGVEG